MKKSTVLHVDQRMLEKYNQPGPRYTSYPTAPHFTADFDANSFMREMEASNRADGEMADVSLYFHFP
ncbi:MAG TPA: coproporphyrinogen III oxidase, partial [Caldithrix abyssi]|nr:coproporphyrinogen III oxidase [Caldithrix abyssi]